MSSDGRPIQYALVAYVRNELGQFVEELRRELHPEHGHLPTHISVLPPRPLVGTEEDAERVLRELAATIAPFTVELGEVESFMPTTPTVFIRVARAAYKMRELHDLLNSDGLEFQEPLPYMPHVTIAKLDTLERAKEVMDISTHRWKEFPGSHQVLIERLTFVRGREKYWTDIADVELSAVPK